MAKGTYPRILSIAGTDPTGGAGIQADLKSIAAAGGYGMSVVTALVAQNTQGVRSVHIPPLDFLQEQLDSVREDVDIDAIKIGMLADAHITDCVDKFLDRIDPSVPVVVDPVMVATSGDRLLAPEAEKAVRELCSRADVITPNLKELAVLTQTEEATNLDRAIEVAQAWAAEAATTVIVKGGHLDSVSADNAVVTPEGKVHRVASARVQTKNSHGTGCSLSSALATRLGAGDDASSALEWSTEWLHEAIVNADALAVGKGRGPVDHLHRSQRLMRAASAVPLPHLAGPLEEVDNPEQPRVAAAGPYTQRLWNIAAHHWEQIKALPFIQNLGSGALAKHAFSFYLDQDSQYLASYSKALARLASQAPDTAQQLHWAQGAYECLAEEAELHRGWLKDSVTTAPSRITSAYTDFLIRSTHTDDYAVGIAAVLPCYWLYAEVGLHLAEFDSPEHPYHAWLKVYGSEDFLDGVRKSIKIVEETLEKADENTRARAERAFISASIHEVDFFDQTDRRF